MLTVKSPDYELTFRSEWDEVTLGEFLKLYQHIEDDEEGAVTFSGRKALEAFASNVKTLYLIEAAEEARIINALPFLTKMPEFDTLPAPTLVLGVVPPTELGICTLMQKWSVDQVITDMNDEEKPVNFFTIAESIIAIYLYPLLQKRPLTDMSQLEEIAALVRDIPCTDALPLSAFFLTSFRNSTGSGRTNFVTSYPKRPKKRWLLDSFRNWKRMLSWRNWGLSRKLGI